MKDTSTNDSTDKTQNDKSTKKSDSDTLLRQSLQSCSQNDNIPMHYLTIGLANLNAMQTKFRTLLTHQRLPEEAWSDHEIMWLLSTLSTMDTNQKEAVASSLTQPSFAPTTPRWCGVGEREGRVYSNLVLSRHFGFTHGVGRSGDITEAQPKAAGSSLVAQLALHLVVDAMRRGSGLLHNTKHYPHAILLPQCTGMSMALVLSSIQQLVQAEASQEAATAEATVNDTNQSSESVPTIEQRNIVLWSRIDQKSCFKAIATAGLQCVVIPTQLDGDVVGTDVDALQHALQTYAHRVVAVISTTSCFAPRIPDAVDAVARLCHTHNVYHVINHAYGLQCATTCALINRACVVGRVDAIIMSTDKNFLVPVGGAVVVSPTQSSPLIRGMGQLYAGRAGASHVIDLLVTLLSMGLQGYTSLLQQRRDLCIVFQDELRRLAERYGERLLSCPQNTISYGLTLDGLVRPRQIATSDVSNDETNIAATTCTTDDTEDEGAYLESIQGDLTRLGSMLFSRCVSGTRVVPRNVTTTLKGGTHGTVQLPGFGSSYDSYPHAYLTAACAIGLGATELHEFIKRLDKTLKEHQSQRDKKLRASKAAS